jgi:CBS domain-containing protein
MNLQAVLKGKPSALISVTPETRVSAVIAVLAVKNIGAVLVVDAQDNFVGILSERDIVRNLATHAGATFDLVASQVMTAHPTTATPNTTVAEAMKVMTDGHFRHLPILEEGKLIGLVSIGDVVKARIGQQEHEVESLRTYVGGSL